MCDVFLPPEVLLHAWAEAAEGVVRIHHHVNDGVDQSSKDSCTGQGWVGGRVGVRVCVCMCVCEGKGGRRCKACMGNKRTAVE